MSTLLLDFFISEYVFAVICISMGMYAFLCEQFVCVFYFCFLRANAFLLLVFGFHVYG